MTVLAPADNFGLIHSATMTFSLRDGLKRGMPNREANRLCEICADRAGTGLANSGCLVPASVACPKCKSARTRIVGRSVHPTLVYRRCDACEYVFCPLINAGAARRILVVDDEEPVRAFAGRVLREAGYEIVVASDGVDALRKIAQQPPFDLFVIDLAMPRMNGDELARQLRALEPDVRVLYFTGYSDRLFKEEGMLGEYEAFVDKPCSVQGLLEAVSLLLFGNTQGPRSTTL